MNTLNLIVGTLPFNPFGVQYKVFEVNYDAHDLDLSTFPITDIKHTIQFDPRVLTSEPFLVLTRDNGYMLLMTDGDEIRFIDSSPNAINKNIDRVEVLSVPDLSGINSNVELPEVLAKFHLPEFSKISELAMAGPTFSKLGSKLIQLYPNVDPTPVMNIETNPVTNINPNSVILNGLNVSFIPFEQMAQMLSQNQIERYIIDPELQYLTTSPNSVLTMFGKNGITYLVKARYDQGSNQIFQPV